MISKIVHELYHGTQINYDCDDQRRCFKYLN
jgi:hypothetical protein